MVPQPSYVVQNANVKLKIPAGWSHTTIAISRQKYQQVVTLDNSLHTTGKAFLKNRWNETGEIMENFHSGETSVAMRAKAQEAIIDFNFYYSTTRIPGDNIPLLEDDERRSHALQIIDFKKKSNAPELVPDYLTLVIFVEDAQANHQARTPFNDMVVVVNLVYGPESDSADDPDNLPGVTQPTADNRGAEANNPEASGTASEVPSDASQQENRQSTEDQQQTGVAAGAEAAGPQQDPRCIQSGGTYRITNVKGGTALDLAGYDNRSIIGWPSHGGLNQQWTINKISESGWTFKSARSGEYLGFSGNATDGTRLITVPFPYEWGVADQAHNYGDPSLCMLFAFYTAQVVELSNYGDPAHGTPVTTRQVQVE